MPLTTSDLAALLDDLRRAADGLQDTAESNPHPPAVLLARVLIAVADCTGRLRKQAEALAAARPNPKKE
jgi:hypothetical protein